MTDTIKKLAMEWKDASDKAGLATDARVDNPSDENHKAEDLAWRRRSTCANVLAMAIAQELGL